MAFNTTPIPDKFFTWLEIATVSAISFIAVISAKAIYSSAVDNQKKKALQAKVQKKQVEVADQKKKLRLKLQNGLGELVTDNCKVITSLGINQLIEKLQNGQLKCIEVLRAYQAKALEATEELNCITEFVAEAEEWAIKLDNSSKKGPLHGIPFSVKDSFPMAGYDVTNGLAKTIGIPMKEDGYLVKALKDLGAIPFCRTNIPQTTLSIGSSNPLWGVTKNPYDPERTPGGSSSGEGSLIGYGGSLFGVGSDVGGSVRIPGSFCGIAAFKSTPTRFISTSAVFGLVGLTPLPGIMARDMETLILIHKLLWENGFMAKYEVNLSPIPWQDKLIPIPRKLRIGYYEQCDKIPVTPGVKRSLQMTRKLLEKDGHELIPFLPPGLDISTEKLIKFIHANEMRIFDDILKYEEIDPTFSIPHFYGRSIPWILRPAAASVLNLFSPIQAAHLRILGGRTMYRSYQLWEEMLKKHICRQELIGKWKQLNLDICIGPIFPSPAPKLKDINWFLVLAHYTGYYNYVDFPAGTVPVTTENEKDQQLLQDYPTNDFILKMLKESTQGAVGLPIGVQVIALPYQDEAALYGMKLIKDLLK